jgi:glycerol-1-phosphate dehydrogenase [NAD(P)+]
MNDHMPIYIGDNAIEECISFCKEKGFKDYYLIADRNTFSVIGERVAQALREQSWDVLCEVLNPDRLHTDDFSITRVLANYDTKARLFVAVGSGTITDITRFTSHRSRNPFVSFPTAASVDAYTSKNAPATINGMKRSINCQAPLAIFTDLPTICSSPHFLTASGVGDLLGKYTSTTDWLLSNMLWTEGFVRDIYERALSCAVNGSKEVDGIAANDPQSLRTMMECQFESGLCMADYNNSVPASGGEHHISHAWEMMVHREGREGLYHGSAVGVATIMEAAWYEQLRALSKADAEILLAKLQLADSESQAAEIRRHFPHISEEIIQSQPILMQLSQPEKLAEVKTRILQHWDAIQAAAGNVPPAGQIRDWLKKVGAPVTTAELGLNTGQAEVGIRYGVYLRERFSINLIRQLFGWPTPSLP